MNGEELRYKRERLGLTQTKLAEELNVPQSTLSRWESGNLVIQHDKVLELAMKYLLDKEIFRETIEKNYQLERKLSEVKKTVSDEFSVKLPPKKPKKLN